jgi:hypothetical protein
VPDNGVDGWNKILFMRELNMIMDLHSIFLGVVSDSQIMSLRTIRINVSCFSKPERSACHWEWAPKHGVYSDFLVLKTFTNTLYFLCLFNLLKIITEYKIFIGLMGQKHMLLEMVMAYVNLYRMAF